MARVYIDGDPFFCDALARRLRPLQDEGLVELLGEPVLSDEAKARQKESGLGVFKAVFSENIDRADIIVLLRRPSDLDPRKRAGQDFESARERHRERRATLLVVPMEQMEPSDLRLEGVRVVPGPDLAWNETDDPDEYLARIVAVVREASSGPPPARIRRIQIRNLSAFDSLDLPLAPGINVFVGPNGTGKTHVLKFLYAALYASEEARHNERSPDTAKHFAGLLGLKLIDVFKPAEDDLKRLLRRGHEKLGGSLEIEASDATISAAVDTRGWVGVDSAEMPNARSPVFIPSREALSLFEGFQALYKQRRLTIDGTYMDLCTALASPPLQGDFARRTHSLLAQINEELGGKIRLDGGRFLLATSQGEIEANLLAEGLRKVATLARLIENESLRKDSVLFWDEPEANLNPLLIKPMVEVLQVLASMGVQIVLATHDYLLAYRLSLAAQYSIPQKVEYRFFSFFRSSPDAPVSVEVGGTMADLDHSPILDEFMAFYDERTEMLARALHAKGESDA